MTEKFTPGPWDRDEVDFSIYQLETSEPITEAMDVVKNGDANSLLIAAAPELYEAVCLLLQTPEIADCDPRDKDEETHVAERKARAALAKARGETP